MSEIWSALDALAAEDVHTLTNADALVQLCDNQLASGDLPVLRR